MQIKGAKYTIFGTHQLQPLKSPYDSCYACDSNGGE